jgi:hypothetical protein
VGHALAWAVGALIPGLLLVPTLVRYGLHGGSGGTLENLHPHWVNPWVAVTTLARLLSFASLEIARFIGIDSAKRLDFFMQRIWLVPVALVVFRLASAVLPARIAGMRVDTGCNGPGGHVTC